MTDHPLRPSPGTLVDRLRGIYLEGGIPCGTYKTSPLHHEAADEIERLREEIGSPKSFVEASPEALKSLLEAIFGPPHLINELRVIHNLGTMNLGDASDPISILVQDYNSWAERYNAYHAKPKETSDASSPSTTHEEEPRN